MGKQNGNGEGGETGAWGPGARAAVNRGRISSVRIHHLRIKTPHQASIRTIGQGCGCLLDFGVGWGSRGLRDERKTSETFFWMTKGLAIRGLSTLEICTKRHCPHLQLMDSCETHRSSLLDFF